ncbi:2-hydroxyacyl-CoA dehydratase [bacterium]|nr:2-hydroxyacyl-CoA dehydratase [bacterium]
MKAWTDIIPRQIDFREWHKLFMSIPDDLIDETRYYRHIPDAEWSRYLFPPSTYLVYGNRLLRKLKFDNSPAALRLWGFVLSEGERIYRARQAGMKVVAVMGDLGALTPLIYSFPDTVAFYPDCLWWTPFMMESKVLFDEAAEFGIGEDCCFVRAALGGFSKRAYFPNPDLNIATVGATCDDMAAVLSEVGYLGYDIHYFELPHRDDNRPDHEELKQFLIGQYRQVCTELESVTGVEFDKDRFFSTVDKVNRLRLYIAEIKQYMRESERNPMGGLELLNAEFAALSYYGDLDECISVLDDLRRTVKSRAEEGSGYNGQLLRLIWVTPPADPLLMNYIEELGGRIVGSEYVINQTTPLIGGEGDPFELLAEAHLNGSLMGSTQFRTELILKQVEQSGAEGAVISGIFGSTHCPYETVPIIEALRKRDVPTLAFDVVAPGKIRLQSQVYNRMEAFMETLMARRSRCGR